MSAYYNGLAFSTRLMAQWAAFFDLAGWKWRANPAPVGNWQPDYKVTFVCGHSECNGEHTLLVSVLPVDNLNGVEGHPCLTHKYRVCDKNDAWRADGGAAFGNSPEATRWEISHGSGGGVEDLLYRVDNANSLWSRAHVLVSD